MRMSPMSIVLAAALAGASCSRAPEHSPAAPAGAGAADPLATLQLDAGKRWSSDDHTRKSVAEMLAAVKAAADDMSPGRTASLGKQLQDLGNKLIAGCTMQGREHEALHAYLGVLLPRIQITTGADAAAALAARGETAAILARFQDYFQ